MAPISRSCEPSRCLTYSSYRCAPTLLLSSTIREARSAVLAAPDADETTPNHIFWRPRRRGASRADADLLLELAHERLTNALALLDLGCRGTSHTRAVLVVEALQGQEDAYSTDMMTAETTTGGFYYELAWAPLRARSTRALLEDAGRGSCRAIRDRPFCGHAATGPAHEHRRLRGIAAKLAAVRLNEAAAAHAVPLSKARLVLLATHELQPDLSLGRVQREQRHPVQHLQLSREVEHHTAKARRVLGQRHASLGFHE